MFQYGEDMSQCHQLRIGLALRPFCLLFLSTLLPHSHDIGTDRLSADHGDLSDEKALLTRTSPY